MRTNKGITSIKIKTHKQWHWLFCFFTWVTSGQNYQQSGYCKTNPTACGVQLECDETKRSRGEKKKVELPLMRPIWCIRFLHMATLVCADSSCSQQITQNALKPMIPIIVWLQHRRHPDQQRDVENWNITRINPPPKRKKKGCGVSLNVDKHSGRRAHENRCWKKLLAFVSPSPPLVLEAKMQTSNRLMVALSS